MEGNSVVKITNDVKDIDDLESILENLSKNAMFALSLCSKELFHSNFLVWVFNMYPKECEEIFVKDISLQEIDIIKREYNVGKNKNQKKCNADIYIKTNDSKEIIIENKCKSIPDKQQLNDYKGLKLNATIILLSYLEPLFEIKEIGCYFWSYKDIKEKLNLLLEKIKDTDKDTENYVIIKNYIDMLELMLSLKECVSIKKQSNKKFNKILEEVENIKKIANKNNFYKFIQKVIFIELGNSLLKDLEQSDDILVNCDVSRNQKIYLTFMLSTKNNVCYKQQNIDYLGITLSEGEKTIWHGIGVNAKSENENEPKTRDDIEKKLNNDECKNLLNWFYGQQCISKTKDGNFWGYDCIKKDGYCWLHKKKEINYGEMTYCEIKNIVAQELKEIRKNLKKN